MRSGVSCDALSESVTQNGLPSATRVACVVLPRYEYVVVDDVVAPVVS